MKTADISKPFLVIFEELMIVYKFATFCGCSMSIKSNDRGCNFALPHLKGALKNAMLYESTYQSGPFTDIHAHSTV